MRNALKSLFSAFRSDSDHRRSPRSCRGRMRRCPGGMPAEALESRTLLASQMIAADAPVKTLEAGQTIDIPVVYQTLDDNGNPAALQGTLISFNLHFDADALTFVESKDFFTEGLQVPPTTVRDETEVPGDDNSAATESVLTTSYSDHDPLFNPGWPNVPSTTGTVLYVARFTAKAGFAGTKINFSANSTGNITGAGGQFEFGSMSVDIQLPPSDPEISIADAPAVTEGQDALFTVSLDKSSTGPVTVQYSTVDGTGQTGALGGADFVARTNQTLTFNAGETQKTIAITTIDDTNVEQTENFGVILSNANGGVIATGTATGSIGDNDAILPRISIADADAVTEGTIASFTVTLSESSSNAVTVRYSTGDGTGPTAATSGIDFFAQTNQLLTFDPGETQKTISIATDDDPIVEPVENFQVTLFNPDGATILDGEAIGLINDNDVAQPTISIADAAAVEEGFNALFTVTLSAASNSDVTVQFSTIDGNGPTAAIGGQDFAARTNETLTFAPGETQKTISVVTTDDPVVENEETFSVLLFNAAGATISTADGTGTIEDNDVAPPTISIADAPAVTEGSNALFTVTLSTTSQNTVTVQYSTVDGNGPNGAMGGSDFVAQSNQVVTFAPGDTQKTISIATLADQVSEGTEEFTVVLAAPNGAAISAGQATGTINDSVVDPPGLSIADAPAVTEGTDSVFTVTLDRASTGTVTVNYSTIDGNGPTGAIGGLDYVSATNQVLTFNPGVTQQSITVSSIDDSVVESDESFSVNLSAPVGATLTNQFGIGTLNDNDGVPLPTLSISDAAAVTEGSTSVFTVTLSADPQAEVSVDVSTGTFGVNPATGGQDFQAQNLVLRFLPGGALTQQVLVGTVDDTVVEETETFAVNLSGALGATIEDSQGVGEIEDNDTPVPPAVLQGAKFNDLNGNGIRESGEPWLNGWTIQLVGENGNLIVEQVTRDIDLDGNNQIDPETETGRYRFEVLPGTYTLLEVQQDGWQQTAPGTPLAALAWQLDQQHQFRGTSNNFENWGGRGERWFIAANDDWYFITPDGSFFRWDGSGRSSLTGEFVASFLPDHWEDPSLIHAAPAAVSPTHTVSAGEIVPNVNFGNISLNQGGSIHGRKWHDRNGDGQRNPSEPWLNGWEIELVNPNGVVVDTVVTMDVDLNNDNQIDPETETGWYWIDDIPAGNWKVREKPQDGWEQTAPGEPADVEAWRVDQDLNLRFTRSLFPNWGGLNERWFLGDNGWHFITPNGDLFEWNGSPRNALSGNRIAQLDPKFHANPALLYDAPNPYEYMVTVSPGENIDGINFGNRETGGPQVSSFPGRGNVQVRVAGPHLILTGDHDGNGVHVYRNPNGLVTVGGLGETTIMGQNDPLVIDGWTTIPGDIRGNLLNGNDAVVISGLQIEGSVAVNTHGDNDWIIVNGTTIRNHLDLRSNTGNNTVVVTRSEIGNLARLNTGNGNDTFYSDASLVGGRTAIATRGGNDLLVTTGTTFTNDVVADLGAGNDLLAIRERNYFRRRVIADGRSGTDAVDVHLSNTLSQAPVLRRFEQNSISDVDSLLDDLMRRLADVGLDGLLGPN